MSVSPRTSLCFLKSPLRSRGDTGGFWVGILLAFLLFSTPARAEAPALALQESCTTVFGGREAVFHASAASAQDWKGRLVWSLAAGSRTLARGEQAVAITAGRPVAATIRLALPEVKDGVALRTDLVLALLPEGGDKEAARLARPLWVFPAEAFPGDKTALRDRRIRLFDPEGTTAPVFEKAGIPFEAASNPDALSGVAPGLVVVGEGVSLKEFRGLAPRLFAAAASGADVVCLALAGGEMGVPGLGPEGGPAPLSLHLRRADVILELDKRLDPSCWPAVTGLAFLGERGPVLAATGAAEGWPWLEAGYAGGGRVVFCGFPLVRAWESGPTPRHLLARLLERRPPSAVPMNPTSSGGLP